MAQDMNYYELIGWALHDLGRLYYLQQDYQQAYTFFVRSMNLTQNRLQKLSIIVHLANIQAFTAPSVIAVEYISLVLNHPSIHSHISDTAEEANRHLKGNFPGDVYEAAWARGKKLDIDEVFQHLLDSVSEQDISVSPLPLISMTANDKLLEPLTERELEVLHLIADGYSNKELCDILFVSKNTVRSHLKHLYSKLDVDSRTRAVATARELGLL